MNRSELPMAPKKVSDPFNFIPATERSIISGMINGKPSRMNIILVINKNNLMKG